MTANKRMTALNSLSLVPAMHEPRTFDQLAVATGFTKNAVQRWVTKMREDKEMVVRPFIAGYAEDSRGRLFTPMWAWGTDEDKPRPGHRQGAAAKRMRAMRARKKGGV